MPRKTPQDPHAGREAAKYDNPIPSREFILELLETAGEPLSRQQLAERLRLHDDEQLEALRRRLRAMERDGQLLRNRRGAYGITSKMDLIPGRVQAHRDGFGFVIPDGGGDDLYLNSKQMSTVFDGDQVLCRVAGIDPRGRREGVIVEVLQRNTRQVVGRLYQESGALFVVPDNNRINQDIFIAPENRLGAPIGHYVVVEILNQPGWRSHPTGKVVEVLGEHMAAGMEIDVAIRSYDLPHVFSEQAMAEAGRQQEPGPEEIRQRVDLRKLPFVTIDGEDARDFDDAVYCESKLWGGWRLWVAIADVSHYVQLDTVLDQEAKQRGTSVYFPERVVPMLPEVLSNGLCSLNPDVDRLTMVCEMTISSKGKLSGYRFFEGVIHSHARLTYNKVAAMVDPEHANHQNLTERYRNVLPHIQQLHKLYKALRKARDKRGAIDFDTVETRIVFGPDRKIETIVPVQRNDAHKMIEECMLCANVATARFLEKHKVPALYRVHEGPNEKKLESLRAYLGELGMDLRGGDKPTPEHYQEVLSQIADRPDAPVIQIMLLRSLSQAVYQPANEGHFGLHYPAYTHFTSPIRRYPDLLVHRAIRHIIRSKTASKQVLRVKGVNPMPKEAIYPYSLADLVVLGEHCSMVERRADDATRDVVAWLKCEYLQEHVGDSFDGVVAAVTNFGLFVELTELYVEGLVHVSSLASDYYHFDPAKQRLVGERTRISFKLGDKVVVKVARVSLDDKKVDLEMVSHQGGTRSGGANKRGTGKPAGKSAAAKKPRSSGKSASADKPAKKAAKGGSRKKTAASGKAASKAETADKSAKPAGRGGRRRRR